LKKIHNIVFNNKNPNNVIHEAFLQHLRDNGKAGSKVHIWNEIPKGNISLSNKPEGKLSYGNVADYMRTKNERGPESVQNWKSKNHIENFLNQNNIHVAGDLDSRRRLKNLPPAATAIRYSDPSVIPSHMRSTYGQQPPKLGYKPAKYGALQTQHNPSLKGSDTWEHHLRKREEQIALLKGFSKKLKKR
jgi:hypothetical protein